MNARTDQKEVEEIKQIGQIRSGDQFPLIRRQPFLLLQLFEHERLPRSFEPGGRDSRKRGDADTLSNLLGC
jgi:hypothetical protein